MSATSGTLTPFWTIGFTGHRHLADPAGMQRTLQGLLEEIQKGLPGKLVGCSSIAIGGDTLFVQACQALGIPWIALLPASEVEFSHDFSQADWQSARELLHSAIDVAIVDGRASREEGYLECGYDTAERADILIAMWDGEPARGMGGTAQVVDYARSLRRPLVIINPKSGMVTKEGFPLKPPTAAELADLGQSTEVARGGETKAQVQELFSVADREAARLAPQFRRWLAASIIMTSGAAIVGAFSMAFNYENAFIKAVAVALTAGAAVAVLYLKYRTHRTWLRRRVTAEICRSALACWNFPRVVAPLWLSRGMPFYRLVHSLQMVHLTSRPSDEPDFGATRDLYLRERIGGQMKYYRRRLRKLRRRRNFLVALFWTFSIAAFVTALLPNLIKMGDLSLTLQQFLSYFLPVALPSLAGCALSLHSVFDLNRRIAKAREMFSFLESARTRVAEAETFHAFHRAAKHIEGILATEILEWFILFQNPRYQ